jgi:hypothetical protein
MLYIDLKTEGSFNNSEQKIVTCISQYPGMNLQK